MSGIWWIIQGLAIGLAAAVARVRLAGFVAQRPEDYAGTEPLLDLRTHLSGRIACHGVIYGPLGRVASRFDGQFEGTWTEDRGTLAEHFVYDSGNTQDREWRLALGANGQLTGEADDIVGQAKGQLSGASLMLRYRIRLPAEAGGHVLSVTDWMYALPGGTIVNRSQFRKYGIKVAELVATMRRMDAE
ncbi:DUF3833 family protein [Roseovarius nanhaiticus]|uniref:DUF3833 domain-containing protein n=1 Tax=Roseovarius nanhaiticus TaxID=573024 RepID=A0A1N7EB28_9RHOB|nr:DUF3833 family protein [Roseovarius nanhaiticus]SEK78300.1 Protein of unknown function [Roseovarius nanhaiticus]SIR85264.1 Protein of unknown function [Roseovarius nanhaiticus]